MQVQKHLFRIAERSNKSQHADICWTIIYIVSLICGLFFLSTFGIGQLYVKHNLHSLQNCFKQNNFVLQPDEIALIYDESSQKFKQILKNTTINPIQSNIPKVNCEIYKNLNTTVVQQEIQFMFTGQYASFKMDIKQRLAMKFDNYTLVLKKRSFYQQLVYLVPILFGNQIISLADSHRLDILLNSTEVYIKSSTFRTHYSTTFNQETNIFVKLLNLLQVFFTYTVASVITSTYIYVTIIASPAFILLILRLTPYGRTQGFFEAFKAFPWIGMHSLILRASNKPEVRGEYSAVCGSLITYFLLMYLGYYTIVLKITNMFFETPIEGGVEEILFGYFAVVQFGALIFMRTRPFLKYFPVINTLMILFFMLYCKFSHLGFKSSAVASMQFMGIALFAWMVLKLQIPAQKTWQPQQQFVPNIKQPRAGLLAPFNLSWINALPDEWTILMPLMSRQNFTQKQLSFVEQNYEQLSEYLNSP